MNKLSILLTTLFLIAGLTLSAPLQTRQTDKNAKVTQRALVLAEISRQLQNLPNQESIFVPLNNVGTVIILNNQVLSTTNLPSDFIRFNPAHHQCPFCHSNLTSNNVRDRIILNKKSLDNLPEDIRQKVESMIHNIQAEKQNHLLRSNRPLFIAAPTDKRGFSYRFRIHPGGTNHISIADSSGKVIFDGPCSAQQFTNAPIDYIHLQRMYETLHKKAEQKLNCAATPPPSRPENKKNHANNKKQPAHINRLINQIRRNILPAIYSAPHNITMTTMTDNGIRYQLTESPSHSHLTIIETNGKVVFSGPCATTNQMAEIPEKYIRPVLDMKAVSNMHIQRKTP